MIQWVQHISGQGKKWEVENEYSSSWEVHADWPCRLPKSEYILCEPPETWVEITRECELKVDPLRGQQLWHKGVCLEGASGYRFRKEQINDPDREPTRFALIVEQRL